MERECSLELLTKVSCTCSPNTVTGDCTVEVLEILSNQLKSQYNVQVLVVAVNGINGGPESFNYQSLAAIASV